jgi:hypothetical protein
MKVRHIKRRMFRWRPPWISISLSARHSGDYSGSYVIDGEIFTLTDFWVGDDGFARLQIERAVHSPQPLT